MNALDALYRCHAAWLGTQPQLFWTNEVLWPDSGLDDTHADSRSCGSGEPVCVVEPGGAASPEPAGLDSRLTAEDGRGSVVVGGNADELALANDGEGVYPGRRVNENDADASEDPAKRVPSSAVSLALNPGDTEPRCATPTGLTAFNPCAASLAPAVSSGSVSPLTYDRPRPQDVAVKRGRGQRRSV